MSIVENFTANGELVLEAAEFEGVTLHDFLDKRLKYEPSYAAFGLVRYDVGENEVQFIRHQDIVYGCVRFENGVETILFKCRQKQHLTMFMRMVIDIAKREFSTIPTEFLNN